MTESYSYTVSSRFENFLESFHERGVPDKFTNATLKEAGYKSTNDRKIKDVLMFIDFLDDKGVPTQRYRDFRNRGKQRKVMAEALIKAYAGLFKIYPDAHAKDRKTLEDFFSAKTKSGKQVYSAMARTFEILCKFADFRAPLQKPQAQLITKDSQSGLKAPIMKSTAMQPQITINIQFVLPKDKDPEVYDSIFASLKKHLLAWESDERT